MASRQPNRFRHSIPWEVTPPLILGILFSAVAYSRITEHPEPALGSLADYIVTLSMPAICFLMVLNMLWVRRRRFRIHDGHKQH